jgi:hypothetical protein
VHKTILTAFFFIFCFQITQAAPQQSTFTLNWEDHVREITSGLKSTKAAKNQAEILKNFRSKLLEEINSAKDMESPVFERKISLFNRMNALFLDKFQEGSCETIRTRWPLIKNSEADNKFEIDQLEEWLNLICPRY